MRDPLKNPTAAVDAVEGGEQDDAQDKERPSSSDDPSERVFTDREMKEGIGHGMSGRKLWKMRHRKGEFNPKLQKKRSNRVPGSFQGRKGG